MDWEGYWLKAGGAQRPGLYEVIAEVYRSQILSRYAAAVLSREFVDSQGRHYLHAGSGSGGSDQRLTCAQARFHCLDLSRTALELNRRRRSGPLRRWQIRGDLFSLPYLEGVMDGIFNFGVMEHFSEEEIGRILAEFHRVLKKEGRLVLFWPPEFGLSVRVLALLPLKLHPPEISRIRSFRWVRDLMARHHFKVLETRFGFRDLFAQVVVVARKVPAGVSSPQR
ncbi:MAG: class I SAM-dependent methyltransferase [Candidatus Omnitrophica bacterium]|nr:class I SAM-dependent methyltransferase [Candidatus Omnitrophota bacterium]